MTLSARRITLCLLALAASSSLAQASPIYVVGGPTRPSIASEIHTTAGLFVSYGVVADPQDHVVAERLTIWDAVRARDVIYTVGPAATIDGIPISCDVGRDPNYSTVLEYMRLDHMCTQLPKKLEPGKTWITILWWDAPKPKNDLQLRDVYPGTDEIHTLLTPPAAPARL